ncbi:AAHS family cis,cis-muconate transporter-like MFS transporter [Acinetobacter baylyi]|uniref:AAHS family cis,cis-muconate transporter-like MFS transporter n=2 Tax=Acinetobacter baylyi TaxID=202950 RepID=A0ABU0USS4_ACIBI|nr:AAHS family cis,cis-muconate transporter-like MFS transporter [Acinetobacter baylyi]MDR6105322.1 AAHS family cis,cis-muconate transporter-like MFS transporter [Acinetobacter baylyi]MDR6184471.1 AAHS family cis,cis-muconate transporter-like MFS transporter [Acinetobacter baylyi]
MHILSEDIDMTTDSITTSQPDQAIQTPKKIWITAFIFAFLALLCDGADLGFLALSLTSLKSEFHLTGLQAGTLGSLTLFGSAIGGLFGGWACDRFGRVRIIVFFIAYSSILTCALGFTHSFEQFAIVRVFGSMGLGALYIACNVLMSEMVPTKHRTTVLATLMTGYTLGSLLATLLAGHIIPEHGWRYLYWLAIVPVVLSFFMHYMVPEPESWKKSRQIRAQQATGGMKEVKRENPYREIFKEKKHGIMFLLWVVSTGALQFGYYGVSNWLPAYLESELGIKFKEMAMYMVGTFIIMIFAKIIAGMIADKLGRRAVFAFGTIGTALFIPVIVYLNTPANILWMMLFFGFLYGIPYAINATYMTESFPTSIRGSAVGGAYNVGKVLSIFSPLTIGYLSQSGSIGLGLLVMAAAYFICGVIPLLFIKDRLYNPQKAD